jgi:hypothetical protein
MPRKTNPAHLASRRIHDELRRDVRRVFRARYEGKQLPLVADPLQIERELAMLTGLRVCGESNFMTREEGASDGS